MRKLVRHLIPGLMTVEAGRFEEPTYGEYERLLRRKLIEEVSEYLEDFNPRELVDIIEVCHALAEDHGLTVQQLTTLAVDKANTRGHLRLPGMMWVVGEP